MEELDFPVFEMPTLPPKQVPPDVLGELNRDLVRRLKESGQYERFWGQPSRQPAPVRFELP
jgi:hypothetical protein